VSKEINNINQEAEDYANAFFYFFGILTIAARNAEEQCELKQYDNVAWEIREDFVRWAGMVLTLPGSSLSKEQREDISRLKTEVESIPKAAINTNNSRSEHIRAMKHPSWDSVRSKANRLISTLQFERDWANHVLNNFGPGSAPSKH
jgi:hypothetical protein